MNLFQNSHYHDADYRLNIERIHHDIMLLTAQYEPVHAIAPSE